MAVKYFLLFAAAAAVFVPVLAIRHLKLQRALYNKLITEFQTGPQEEIVKAHNAFRRKVSPSARNMLKMSWSKAAAGNARVLARYCDMSESDPLERKLNNTFCGENRHLGHYPYSWSKIIEIWHNESKHFTYGEWPSSDDDFETDHYTQMVWASSYLIGCDVASCRRQKTATFLYVCHYCHEGNNPYSLNMPYKEGTPCGDCPNDCEDGLCKKPFVPPSCLTASARISATVFNKSHDSVIPHHREKTCTFDNQCDVSYWLIITNPCPYYDEYNNCGKKLTTRGCSHPSAQLFCKASCLCTTEIK